MFIPYCKLMQQDNEPQSLYINNIQYKLAFERKEKVSTFPSFLENAFLITNFRHLLLFLLFSIVIYATLLISLNL